MSDEFDDLTPEEDYSGVEGLVQKGDRTQMKTLQIFRFQLVERSSKMQEGWEGPETTKNPVTNEEVISYYLPHDTLISRIADMYIQRKTLPAEKGGGKLVSWNFIVLVGQEQMKIQLSFGDRVWTRLMKVFPNLNLRRPFAMSVFPTKKDGKTEQAVAFYQCQTADFVKDVKQWAKVPEYWVPSQTDQSGRAIRGCDYVGADGSVLPPPDFDEDNGWDFKPPRKFLSQYFKKNMLPRIKAVAATHGMNHADEDTDISSPNSHAPAGDELTHTGPAQPKPQRAAFDPNEKPANAIADTALDMIDGQTRQLIIQMAGQMGKTADVLSQKLYGANLEDLNEHAGQFLLNRMRAHINKQAMEHVAPAPAPKPPPPAPKPAPPPVVDNFDDDDVEFGPGTVAPAAPVRRPPPPADDDDFDI